MSKNVKTAKKSKSKNKTVRINEEANTVRQLSDETKQINRELSRSLKGLIFNTRNNIENGDETIVYGIDEIQPRLSKTRRKEHITNTLAKVKNAETKSKSKTTSTCAISGGKRYKNKTSKRCLSK